MRIFHCIPNLAGGGAERQLCYLAAELAARGDEVHVAFARGGENLGLLEAGNCILHPIQTRSSFDPDLVRTLYRTIRTVRPHLVQTWLLQMDVAGGIASLASGTPFILSERASEEAYPPSAKYWIRRLIGARAAAVVSNSRGGFDYWRSRNKSALSRVIANGVPVISPYGEGDRPYRNADLESHPGPLLLFAGRLSDQKNVRLLIDALVVVLKGLPDVRALILGDGPLRGHLEAQIAVHALQDRLVLGGYASNVRTWMRAAARFLFLSSFEGHPNVVVEAALEQCPLILSNIPAHHAILDEESAVFVDHTSVTQITEAIKASILDNTDAKARAARAYRRMSAFTIPSMADGYQELYAELIAGSRTS